MHHAGLRADLVELALTDIPGCFRLRAQRLTDSRGVFLKTFSAAEFSVHGVDPRFAETYVTVSHKAVLRGLHFQRPPHDHDKLVWCLDGSALDVVVDLRRGSPAFGRATALELHSSEPDGVFVPRGCAHGFLALEDRTMMAYAVTSAYAPEHDAGIRWDSVGFDWPIERPIVSPRDESFPALAELATEFTFGETT